MRLEPMESTSFKLACGQRQRRSEGQRGQAKDPPEAGLSSCAE
jgi:hypothetical protein